MMFRANRLCPAVLQGCTIWGFVASGCSSFVDLLAYFLFEVMIIERGDGVTADFNSTLAQLASDKSSIDWTVNCGNMSAALPLFLLTNGLLSTTHPTTSLRIFNTNTAVVTDCCLRTPNAQPSPPDDTEIPGVPGAFPWVELSMRQPVGSRTALLLPTGNIRDVFDGVEASCLDVAVPMVILSAAAVGLRGDESVSSLNNNEPLKARLRSIWTQAGLAMKLKKNGVLMTAEELAVSETVPKLCLVSPPKNGGNISARYFTPQESHSSLAVTGGCCLATACLIPGTIAHDVASGLCALTHENSDRLVAMENPAGILRARVFGCHVTENEFVFPWVAYERNAQLLIDGFFRVHQPSRALQQRALELQAAAL
jgi:4-oxalomesaconate tautomerase